MKKTGFIIFGLILILLFSCAEPSVAPMGTTGETGDTAEKAPLTLPAETSGESEPYVVQRATVGVAGDVLIHNPVHRAAKLPDGTYDFGVNYALVGEYLKKYDFAVANMEGTFGGADSGFEYPSGYPRFNCPDSVADALKDAGVDLLLTANNHTNDTGEKGVLRTVQVIREKGLGYLGTRDSTDESFYQVKDIGGIKVGMACFTYGSIRGNGTKSLNGLPMTKKASELVSVFDPSNPAAFYEEAEKALLELEEKGAEFTLFYLHWGMEYQLTPNATQKEIAMNLCRLGVDVIVGGHPHVIQPFETLTAENGNKTLCIYSIGNFLSNQRREYLSASAAKQGNTEDGMIFEITFQRWSDGSVSVGEVDVLPLWVNREKREGKWIYQVVPLDLAVADWREFSLNEKTLQKAIESYDRTMGRVAPGLNEARVALGLEPVPERAFS